MKYLYEYKIKDGDKERAFVLTKPTRRQREAAERRYAVEMSNCIRDGILTRSMLAKKYDDTGGILTEEENKQITGMYHKLKELVDEHTRLDATKGQSKKTKDKLKTLGEEIAKQRKAIAEVETQSNYLFTQTAETIAQTKVINWYSLHLLHEIIDGEPQIFFDGETYDDKLDQYYAREDEQDNTYLSIMEKAGTVMSLWYFSGGASAESIDKMIEELLGEKKKDGSEG